MTLIDRSWLARQLPSVSSSKVATPSKIRGIGSFKHWTDEYVLIPLYFIEKKDNGTPAYASVERELHLVEGLRANILIANDLLRPEDVSINIAAKTAYIGSFKIKIALNAK